MNPAAGEREAVAREHLARTAESRDAQHGAFRPAAGFATTE